MPVVPETCIREQMPLPPVAQKVLHLASHQVYGLENLIKTIRPPTLLSQVLMSQNMLLSETELVY